jgi:hypothetical protein
MVEKCLANLVSQGVITRQEADVQLNSYNQLIQSKLAGGQTNPLIAAAQAQKQLAGQLRESAEVKRLRAALQTKSQADLLSWVNKVDDVKAGVDAIFTPDWRDRYHRQSLEYRVKSHQDIALSFLAEGFANVKRTFTGEVETLTQQAIHKELQGVNTGNAAAKAFAEGLRRTYDYLDTVHAAAGGAKGKIANYDVPHKHSTVKVRQATKDGWVNEVMPMLDRQKMLDHYTGLPMNDVKLRSVLEEVWESIARDGMNKRNAGTYRSGSVANRFDKERVLHFKDNAWFDYNTKYGETDIVSAALDDITVMSRDIAMMETFGPNVNGGIQFLKDISVMRMQDKNIADAANPQAHGGGLLNTVTKAWIKDENLPAWLAYRKEQGMPKRIDEWLDIAQGRTFDPGGARSAYVFDQVRGVLASAQLGSAILSATGDLGTMGWTAKFNGLEATKIMKDYVKALTAGKSKEELRVFAAELGLVVEHLHGNILAKAQFDMQLNKGFGTVMADKVLRWQGLTRHTDAMRISFSVHMAQNIAKNFGKEFADLPSELQRGLKINGITPDEWNIVRQSNTIDRDGVAHVNIADIMRMEDMMPGAHDAALKVSQYIKAETDKAIITSGWKFERGFIDRVGVRNQAGRFMAQYKRYPVLILYNHVGRMFSQEAGGAERALYGAGFVATMTLLGALALTLKDLAAGRDPRSWDSPQFVFDAFLQGGAGGIIGDYVKTAFDSARQKRYGDAMSPFAAATLGPIWGLGGDAINAIGLHNITDLLNGEPLSKVEKKAGEDIYKMAKYLPGNNLWYSRLFVDRWIEDGLVKMMGSNPRETFSRRIRNYKNNYGQDFWWRPGALSPHRGPDIGSDGE